MKLTFSGELDSSVSRRVFGPDRYGGYCVETHHFYDSAVNKTYVFVRPLNPDEVPNITYDSFWQEYLADSNR